ncbi:MAG: pyridoxamine 5'-phosphate oxidase family protein [Termitinemataceae bacterium]
MYTILDQAAEMHLGLWDGSEVYVVPLNFVRIDTSIYFHSASEGRKISILKQYPKVCFEVTGAHEVEPDIGGAHCTTRYESVIGWGEARLITELGLKHTILCALNSKFGASTEHIPEKVIEQTTIVEILIERLTGKSNRSSS